MGVLLACMQMPVYLMPSTATRGYHIPRDWSWTVAGQHKDAGNPNPGPLEEHTGVLNC